MEHFARCKYWKKTRRHVENSTLTTYYVAFHTGRFVWEVVIPPFPKNTCVGGDIWIIIRFQETAHLPLPYANINTYFSLRAKCWLMGRGRWAVFQKLLSQGLERGVLIPHSRFVFTRTPHPELLSLLFQISFFSQSPISCPNFGASPFPGAVKSPIPLTFPESRTVFWSNPGVQENHSRSCFVQKDLAMSMPLCQHEVPTEGIFLRPPQWRLDSHFYVTLRAT